MNILFISSQFPNLHEPNRGIFSLQIVRELSGFAEVRVVAPVPTLGPLKSLDSLKRYRTDYDIPAQETIDGITVYHPKYFAMPRMGFLHHLPLRNALQALIAGLRESWPIDAVNCHWVFPDGVAAQKVCESLGIPLLLTPLGTDLNEYGSYLLRKNAIRNALTRADQVSVLSTPMHERCLSMGVEPQRLKSIPNGVDLEKFSPRERSACRRELGLPEEAQLILFVGSLVPVKGIDSLLKAFALLKKAHPAGELRLYLVGSGYLEADLRRLAAELGIGSDTVFIGAVEHRRLPVWMNSADCLCLPSLNEGHPNVVMEALACGLPVVASAVGSIPDYVTEATGFLTTPGDPAGLCEKLGSCLSTSYQKTAIRGTVQELSWKDCAGKYYQAMQGLTACSDGRA